MQQNHPVIVLEQRFFSKDPLLPRFTLLWDDFTIYLGEIEHLPVICDPNNLVIVYNSTLPVTSLAVPTICPTTTRCLPRKDEVPFCLFAEALFTICLAFQLFSLLFKSSIQADVDVNIDDMVDNGHGKNNLTMIDAPRDMKLSRKDHCIALRAGRVSLRSF